MSWFLVIDVCIALLFVALGVLALTNRGYKLPGNRVFACLSLSMLVWLITNQISNDITNNPSVAIIANYFLFSASFITTILTVRLVTLITNDKIALKFIRHTEWLMWVVAALSATPLVGADVSLQGDVYAVEFGPLIGLYGGLIVCMIAVLFWITIRNWNHHLSATRHQIRTVGTGLLLTAPLVLLLGLLLPYATGSFVITQVSLAPMIILAFALYRSVVQHRLFDIKLVAVRTLVYILSIATTAMLYFGLAYIVSTVIFHQGTAGDFGVNPISVILALLLALIFQPIKNFFDRATDRIFFRGRYKTDDFLANISNIIATTNVLSDLLDSISDEVIASLKPAHITICVYDNGRFITQRGKNEVCINHASRDRLRECLELADGPLLVRQAVQETYMHTVAGSIYKELDSNGVTVALSLNDGLGYILLGEQRGAGYSEVDIKVLSTLAGELSVAIQNALSLEEVKELNETLQKKIDIATSELRATNEKLMKLDETKDEFISMASHQLRTPLTSIKGYISMVLEGDAGKITDRQRALLTESFASSERMVHLISDFLNVSRLQTGKFMIDASPTNLADVVAGEVASIQRMAEGRDINIEFRKPKVFPVLNIDENKLRQVMMNLIDNAIYYSPMGSTIEVKLVRYDGEVRFEVHDQGMGVPLDVQHRLFTKFFRADNARKQRPDGTGIGLYLAKKVITEQGGDIIFSSKPGKGSVFGFRLPIAPLRIK